VTRLLARPRKTVQDFLNLPEGTRAELIDGEILMSPSPRVRHQTIAGRLYSRISAFVESRRPGAVFTAPLDVHLPSGDIVEPDLIVVAEANRAIIQDWIRGAPDLLVEVVSPDRPERDRIIKRGLYARNGVGEYWIVDDGPASIEVLALSGSIHEPRGFFLQDDELASPFLPGLRLSLREVFQQEVGP
jgi:Uma2 family endonuclease